MARKKAARKVRPKTPARIRKSKRARKARGAQHHELAGLGLLALGLFLAAVLWLGWDGGVAGARIDGALDRLLGDARHVVPAVLVVLGALWVARSSLVDLSPFRTGLVVAAFGIMTSLGADRGGGFGRLIETMLGRLVGGTGTAIIGIFAVTTGAILVTGASLGAILRRSARAARETAALARRSLERMPTALPVAPTDGPAGRALRRAVERARRLPPSGRVGAEALAAGRKSLLGCVRADGRGARPRARHVRRRCDDRRRGRGAAGHALRAPARARHQGGQGRGAEGRPRVRTRDDG